MLRGDCSPPSRMVPDRDVPPLSLAELIDLGAQRGRVRGDGRVDDPRGHTVRVPDRRGGAPRHRGRNGYAFLWQPPRKPRVRAHTDGAGYRSAFRSQGDGSSTRRTAARETGLDWDADPEDALSELAPG